MEAKGMLSRVLDTISSIEAAKAFSVKQGSRWCSSTPLARNGTGLTSRQSSSWSNVVDKGLTLRKLAQYAPMSGDEAGETALRHTWGWNPCSSTCRSARTANPITNSSTRVRHTISPIFFAGPLYSLPPIPPPPSIELLHLASRGGFPEIRPFPGGSPFSPKLEPQEPLPEFVPPGTPTEVPTTSPPEIPTLQPREPNLIPRPIEFPPFDPPVEVPSTEPDTNPKPREDPEVEPPPPTDATYPPRFGFTSTKFGFATQLDSPVPTLPANPNLVFSKPSSEVQPYDLAASEKSLTLESVPSATNPSPESSRAASEAPDALEPSIPVIPIPNIPPATAPGSPLPTPPPNAEPIPPPGVPAPQLPPQAPPLPRPDIPEPKPGPDFPTPEIPGPTPGPDFPTPDLPPPNRGPDFPEIPRPEIPRPEIPGIPKSEIPIPELPIPGVSLLMQDLNLPCHFAAQCSSVDHSFL